MAKDPAFLFYPGDFNTGTQFFSDEQVGKYMRLLMAQHQHGHLTDKQVLIICKSHDKEVMAKFKKDPQGNFFNERLEVETIRRQKFSESRSKNRTSDKKTSSSYVPHMETKNETETINWDKEWSDWGKLIVEENDQYWEQMKGRKITQEELNQFLSVATRNDWEMKTQHKFRVTLNGFKANGQVNGETKISLGDKKALERKAKGL